MIFRSNQEKNLKAKIPNCSLSICYVDIEATITSILLICFDVIAIFGQSLLFFDAIFPYEMSTGLIFDFFLHFNLTICDSYIQPRADFTNIFAQILSEQQTIKANFGLILTLTLCW